jgi:hypothetical protein
MKRNLISALLVSATVFAAAPSFAQSTDNNGPLTRAEVRAQLVQAEEAGRLPQQTARNDFPNGRVAQPRQYAVAPHHVSNTNVANTAATSTQE